MKLSELEEYFKDNPPPDSPIKINGFTTINDPKYFINACIQTLKSNPGNKLYMAYYIHLLDLYNYLQEIKLKIVK